jgi:hypothetical protein
MYFAVRAEWQHYADGKKGCIGGLESSQALTAGCYHTDSGLSSTDSNTDSTVVM